MKGDRPVMKVSDLRAALDGLPDDMPVRVAFDGGLGHYDEPLVTTETDGDRYGAPKPNDPVFFVITDRT